MNKQLFLVLALLCCLPACGQEDAQTTITDEVIDFSTETVDCEVSVLAGAGDLSRTLQERVEAETDSSPLMHNTVLLKGTEGGDYIASVEEYRHGGAEELSIHYLNQADDTLVTIWLSGDYPEEVEKQRAVIERVVRTFFVEKGFTAVSGISLGEFDRLDITSTSDGLTLVSEYNDRSYRFLLEPADSISTTERTCPAGCVCRVAADETGVIAQFMRPVARTDWEGGYEWCEHRMTAVRLVAQEPPKVIYRGRTIAPKN
ncbi:hypothetical protein GF356_05665 [candidate division GN15 bacterium]|nr:hypothetical protein [candidate division GN15 bacterium]